MPTVLRPAGHEQQMSLVEHLDELRTRLLISLFVFLICFGIAFWQSDHVLDAVNRPFKIATQHTTERGPLSQTATFQRNLGDLATRTEAFAQAVAADENASAAAKSTADALSKAAK